MNQGHRHPKIIEALKEQADRVTLTSRAFHSDQLGPWYEKVANLTQKEMVLPMNTGAEAVETALKAVRRWGYDVKGDCRKSSRNYCLCREFPWSYDGSGFLIF